MEIVQMPDAWRAIFFPDAEDGPLRNEWAERGYRIQLGLTDDPKEPYVPKYVDYDKEAFSIEDAIFYAKNIKDCELCKNLNSEVATLKKIVIPDNGGTVKSEEGTEEMVNKEELREMIRQAVKEAKSEGDKPEERKDKVSNIFQSVALDFFKSYFTEPGLIMLSIILDDPGLLEGVIPEDASEEDMLALRSLIADYLSGEVGLVRTPDELREYSRSLKAMLKPEEVGAGKAEGEKKSEVDKKLKDIGSAVILGCV